MKTTQWLIAAAAAAAAVFSPSAQAYQPVENRLMTVWGEAMTPDSALPEYPRPNLMRSNWQNLNGLWQYAVLPRTEGRPGEWQGEILVPFAIESALSGVKRLLEPSEQLWYKREFKAEFKAGAERILLHFGAVDYRTQVFVNGVEVTDAPHENGTLPFTIDITDAAKSGNNELVVSVWDPTDTFLQASGKQSLNPNGCFYSRVSGIWQTVWTEVVPAAYISGYRIVTDIDKGTVSVYVQAEGRLQDAAVAVEAVKDGKTVAKNSGSIWGGPIVLTIKNPLLWSPETPNLYDLRLTLSAKGSENDVVSSYFGMRKIEWKKDEKGVPRFYLNNQKTFMIGTLDQGWWPDGLLTPPGEDAMKFDIQTLKSCGFNMMRKHIKVEPLRYYYLCDKLGILVWQDMVSGAGDAENRYTFYRNDLKEMVDLLQPFPCIVGWVPYNESWGQSQAAKTNMTFDWLKRYDPTRFVDGVSGWNDYGKGDTKDMHHYPEPDMFPVMNDRVSVLGEFGGLGFDVAGHLWEEQHWGYVHDTSAEQSLDRYRTIMETLAKLASEGLAASVYTQTTDVERETNGLLTYDRKVIKYPAPELAALHKKVLNAAKTTHIPVRFAVLPSSAGNGALWKYTFTHPGENWFASGFDDSVWQQGQAGFGNDRISRDQPAAKVRTNWDSSDIWMRREFEYQDDPGQIVELMLNIFYDEDTEVYLNGMKIADLHGFNAAYSSVKTMTDARKQLKKGRNTLAVHATNKEHGAYIDLGLDAVKYK